MVMNLVVSDETVAYISYNISLILQTHAAFHFLDRKAWKDSENKTSDNL